LQNIVVTQVAAVGVVQQLYQHWQEELTQPRNEQPDTPSACAVMPGIILGTRLATRSASQDVGPFI
jgi:hypothetical protein